MVWRVWIWAFDLHEAFGTDGLVAAASSVQVRWIVKKANRTFFRVLVKIRFNGLTVDT